MKAFEKKKKKKEITPLLFHVFFSPTELKETLMQKIFCRPHPLQLDEIKIWSQRTHRGREDLASLFLPSLISQYFPSMSYSPSRANSFLLPGHTRQSLLLTVLSDLKILLFLRPIPSQTPVIPQTAHLLPAHIPTLLCQAKISVLFVDSVSVKSFVKASSRSCFSTP